MMRTLAILGILLAAAIPAFAGTVVAGQGLPKWMPGGAPVVAPSGFAALCTVGSGTTGICAYQRSGGIQHANVSDSSLARLEAFNRAVNAEIRYRTDWELFGVADRWIVATAAGDCEDIALAKRVALIEAGWPPKALWLAIGHLPGIGSHAVLIVRSERGDLVLDSLSDNVQLWHQSRVRWQIREVPGSHTTWQLVGSNS